MKFWKKKEAYVPDGKAQESLLASDKALEVVQAQGEHQEILRQEIERTIELAQPVQDKLLALYERNHFGERLEKSFELKRQRG